MTTVRITLAEAKDADEPFDLEMAATVSGCVWPHHIVAANLPFGTVLKEVASFLDLNVR